MSEGSAGGVAVGASVQVWDVWSGSIWAADALADLAEVDAIIPKNRRNDLRFIVSDGIGLKMRQEGSSI